MERETGIEPATSTLARLRSTAKLLPHVGIRYQISTWPYGTYPSYRDSSFSPKILRFWGPLSVAEKNH